MLLAFVVTLFDPSIDRYLWIGLGVVIGGVIGTILARRVELTEMPQLVAAFNGFGGGASVLVAGAELLRTENADNAALIAAAASGIIGAVTFFGSFVAFGKLQGLQMFKKDIRITGQQLLNGVLAIVMILLAAWCVRSGGSFAAYLLMCIVGSVLGVTLTVGIGGADMPVVIALLNSYSGLAAAATGFVIDNNVLIISGALVGASGLILTQIMCKAMNRSLPNVLFGVMGGGAVTSDAEVDAIYATVRRTSSEDVAMILDTAQRVVFRAGLWHGSRASATRRT